MTAEERMKKATKIIDDMAKTAATTTAVFSQIPGMGVATAQQVTFNGQSLNTGFYLGFTTRFIMTTRH